WAESLAIMRVSHPGFDFSVAARNLARAVRAQDSIETAFVLLHGLRVLNPVLADQVEAGLQARKSALDEEWNNLIQQLRNGAIDPALIQRLEVFGAVPETIQSLRNAGVPDGFITRIQAIGPSPLDEAQQSGRPDKSAG